MKKKTVSRATFKHLFGGWREAEARRWTNPDGSEGGIVAVSANVEPSVTLPASVEVWPDAKIIGDGASIPDILTSAARTLAVNGNAVIIKLKRNSRHVVAGFNHKRRGN